MKNYRIPINGMHCNNCAASVEKKISKLESPENINVSYADESLNFSLKKENPEVLHQINNSVIDAGFKLLTKTSFLKISGMHCTNCSMSIEKNLNSIFGIIIANVNLGDETLAIEYIDSIISIDEIIKKIESIGFKAFEIKDNEDFLSQDLKEAKNQKIKFITGLVFTIPLFLVSMTADMTNLLPSYPESFLMGLLLFILATPVQFFTGFDYYKGAYTSLKNGSSNMDVLVALGSSAAYFYSTVILFTSFKGDHLYFETSAVIITLIKLGKMLEARTKGKTGEAVKKLLDLTPKKVLKENKDGTTESKNLSEIEVNDIIIVKPGENIPVDGEIVYGKSAINESMLTGESLPADKNPGDLVTGGTLNINGLIKIKATAIGKDSVLAKIVEIVRHAQGSKAPVQEVADRVAAVFVPFVIISAIITFSIWYFFTGDFTASIVRLTAVLVIACPCALGLATPTALMAGAGKGAVSGVLFKSGKAIQKLASVKTIIIDKTGTLTKGEPSVLNIYKIDKDFDEEKLLSIATSIEKNSNHPVSSAITKKGISENAEIIECSDFEEVGGMGVKGKIENIEYKIGKPGWFDNLPKKALSILETVYSRGNTPAVLSANNSIKGVFEIHDEIKEDSKQAIKELKNLGLKITLLTGDNEKTAANTAKTLGIDDYIAEATPDSKAKLVKDYQAKYGFAAMVGDGINDAPALATAHSGIALGTGTDVAIESADIILPGHKMRLLPYCIRLSKKTLKTIKLNLFWAFVYNILLIPIAAGILAPFPEMPDWIRQLNPMVAAFAMSMSSIMVVSSSLLLYKSRDNIN
ncbi:MAG: heavy metal translocating P-type ATPase [Desulforegulaceae bacterium]|nr:heavy metal translocating P-type ATPase [Desulforegulaceae bacterium]